MKKILIVIILLICSEKLISQENVYYPQVFFDKEKTAEMLAPGKSTIEGVAFTREKETRGFGIKTKTGEKHYAKSGTIVFLFPCTEYFDEWYKLRRKKENKKTHVYMSEEAYKYRIETVVSDYGRFKFEKLKPGKYYLETIIDFTATGSYKEETGRLDSYNVYGGYLGSTPSYSTFFYNYEDSNREKKFVEITQDGQILSVKL